MQQRSGRSNGAKVIAIRIMAIVLIAAGLLSLMYGGFNYTRETQKTEKTESGSLKVFVKETRTVQIPAWADIGAIIAGGLLLALANRKD
jgi:flagellar basal body-associated protein FliL